MGGWGGDGGVTFRGMYTNILSVEANCGSVFCHAVMLLTLAVV